MHVMIVFFCDNFPVIIFSIPTARFLYCLKSLTRTCFFGSFFRCTCQLIMNLTRIFRFSVQKEWKHLYSIITLCYDKLSTSQRLSGAALTVRFNINVLQIVLNISNFYRNLIKFKNITETSTVL